MSPGPRRQRGQLKSWLYLALFGSADSVDDDENDTLSDTTRSQNTNENASKE
ncbi:hypothetical protein ACFQJ7_14020 [Halovenus rubra]|uniref:Uncharacterized protein n=2 Tax=Halovenus rubra TaxID=869890 RepID=A0ABD5XB43_9EURY|nr:hypothetical protein [Halovenus rubra]